MKPGKSFPTGILITGGAGFIGTNLAHRLLSQGHRVTIFDNLSRSGVRKNLEWLTRHHPDKLEFMEEDVRNVHAVTSAVRRADMVYHFAAQVAVTTSLTHPVEDFEINARGTLNLLEAIRCLGRPVPLVFTSTNKVYGQLAHLDLEETDTHYAIRSTDAAAHGVNERRPVEFHSPYGCSKGAADQYVLDYARTFGLPACVFRMSCIYGSHQCGNEDQGWVAHFLLQALQGLPITLYGTGKQVRDILHVDDLVEALQLAGRHMPRLMGHPYNIGGGPANRVSLLEVVDLISRICGSEPQVITAGWRAADQKYYVSDYRRFSSHTGWRPRISAPEGIALLQQWFQENLTDLSDQSKPVPTAILAK